MPKQSRFWSVEDRLDELSAQGNSLEKLLEIVEFEFFRSVLVGASRQRSSRGEKDAIKAGRSADEI